MKTQIEKKEMHMLHTVITFGAVPWQLIVSSVCIMYAL